jgi:hypothetical protein
MPLRSLLCAARQHVRECGAIPLDIAARLIDLGMNVNIIERKMRKELGL